MKKANKKGFILVETLIVTVFVVTLFLFVYNVVVPSIGEYEQQSYYDDIDSIYYSNLYKQMITRYAKADYIDSYLNDHTYIDITDCNNTNIYSNNSYCQLVKESIGLEDGKVILTDYNIKKFKQEVKTNDFFDSDELSNFRDYLNTVSNYETFYTKLTNETNYVGKYRLFVVRMATDTDSSKSRRFINLGIYTGKNNKYMLGEKVIYNPGDGDKEFYVLKNSATTDQFVTLILADNLADSTTCFNSTKTVASPNSALDILKAKTNTWTNVDFLTNYTYTTPAGYAIEYNGYRARLLEKEDIINALGCKEDEKQCFDVDEAFDVTFNNDELSFLTANLNDTNGYWTAMAIKNSDTGTLNIPDEANFQYAMAWAVQKGKIAATNMTDCTNIGVRPVIKVEKSNIVRGQ